MQWGAIGGDPWGRKAVRPEPEHVPTRSLAEPELLEQDPEGLEEVMAATMRALSVRPGADEAMLRAMTQADKETLDAALHNLTRHNQVKSEGQGVHRRWLRTDSPPLPGFLLPRSALRLLDAVERHPGTSAKELAERSGLGASEVSRLGSRLEESGWITRVSMGHTTHYLPRESSALGS